MQEEIVRQLKKAAFCEALTETQLQQLCVKSKLCVFKKGELIFCQGDESRSFYIVLQGWVTVIRENKNAEQTVLHVVKDGESFAEPAALTLKYYPANAYAASDCKLLEIRTEQFRKMIQQDPEIAMHLIARLSHRLRNMVSEFEQLKTMSVARRLSLFLLELTSDKNGTAIVELPFNKTVLAAYMGIQPESLSRAFNQLRKQGVKSDRSARIVINDIEQLRVYAESQA